MAAVPSIPGDTDRTEAQIRQHYDVEIALADRLRNSTPESRSSLYLEVYEELFDQVPHHPQLHNKETPEGRQEKVRQKRALLDRFINADSTVVEVGAGDCLLSKTIAPHVKHVYAVDISPTIVEGEVPANVEIVLSNGTDIPVPADSVDVVTSDQLMEHLHPDDAVAQLSSICKALKPGGAYICHTPNRLSGPHDVSKYYDKTARGLHLREYTYGELMPIFREAGFDTFLTYAGGRGRYLKVPTALMRLFEGTLDTLGSAWLGRLWASRAVLGVNLVALKAGG